MKTLVIKITLLCILLILTTASFSQSSLHCLEFLDLSTGITVGNNGIIYRTIDAGNSWSQIASYVSKNLNNTTAVDGDIVVIVGDNSTILQSIDAGLTFQTIIISSAILLPYADFHGVSINSDGIGFIAGTNGMILKTTDHGTTWAVIQSNKGADLNAVSLFSTDKGIIVGENNSISFTTDGGETWQQPGTSLSFQLDLKFVRMVDKNTAYATSSKGHIIKTTDGGNSWVLIYSDPDGYAFSRINRTGPGSLIAAGNNGRIIISYDNGQSWTTQNTGTTNDIYCLAFAGDMTGFAGGEAGMLIRTDDGGQNWYSVNNLLYNTQTKQSKGTSINVFQNYPNPFNPSTVISYSIPSNASVTLKVYDMLGKEVKTLVNGIQSSGSYNFRFDGSNLSSGIYFYVLKANMGNNNEISKTMRMILTK